MPARCRCPPVSRRTASRKYVTMPGGFSYVNSGDGQHDVWVRQVPGTTVYEAIDLNHYGDPYAVSGFRIDLAEFDDDRIEVALSYFDELATARDKKKVVAALVTQDGAGEIFSIPADDIKEALLRAAGMFGSPRRRR